MKYIKTYEQSKFKYDVGNYVKLVEELDKEWTVSTVCKIISKGSLADIEPDYYIETYMLDTKTIENFWIDEYDIERLATLEEIEAYNYQNTISNYNL